MQRGGMETLEIAKKHSQQCQGGKVLMGNRLLQLHSTSLTAKSRSL